MSRILVHANEATAAKRYVYFDLRDQTDGITAETGEAGGQPQVSINGAAWAGAGSIGVLVAIGNGRYYAELAQASIATAGDLLETRYDSANTAESPGDSVQVVGFDPTDDIVEAAIQNNNLDHLLKTAVANNADMTTEMADGSILSNIITKGSDTSDFVVADDSLEAIRDNQQTAAQAGANAALVALNLDHLMKVAVANNADMTVEVVDGTVLCNIMTKGSDTSDFTVADNSLEGLADGSVTLDTTTAIDGSRTIQDALEAIVAEYYGKSDSVDMGNGTKKYRMYKQDGTSILVTIYHNTDGEHTIVSPSPSPS